MAVIVEDFLARRYAQIYADKFEEDHAEAEEWAKKKIKREDMKSFQMYVIKELESRGFTSIVPVE